jgi:hypothetical protein
VIPDNIILNKIIVQKGSRNYQTRPNEMQIHHNNNSATNNFIKPSYNRNEPFKQNTSLAGHEAPKNIHQQHNKVPEAELLTHFHNYSGLNLSSLSYKQN